MLDFLSEYLDTATSPEEKQHLILADKFLNRAQDDNYEHVLEEIVLTEEDMDSGVAIQSIRAVYRERLYYFFNQHGITLVEDLSLKTLADLGHGVLDLDNYEQPQALFDLAGDDAMPLERFCVMLTQTTQYNVDQLLHVVEDVADGFINRLKETLFATEPEDDDPVNTRDRIIAYRKFLLYLQTHNLTAPRIDQVVRQGGAGLPYEFYAKLIDSQQALETSPIKQIALELFAAALVSGDGYGHPTETVKNSLEQFISDPQTVAKVMVEVRQVLLGYEP